MVLRIPLVTQVGSQKIKTIDAHNEVCRSMGEVLFGKFGAAIAGKTLESLRAQISAGIDTRLILISKVDNKSFVGHQSTLVGIFSNDQVAEVKRFTPPYYAALGLTPGIWFKINKPFEACQLASIRLHSNKKNLLEVASACRTPAMLVEV